MELKVINDQGNKSIDWWFMYKLPENLDPKTGAAAKFKKSTGLEYMYFEAGQTGLMQLSSKKLNNQEGALYNTLKPIYGAGHKFKDTLGWICYNDEKPATATNDDEKGHTKGILSFDLKSDTAIWLLHSWPKFPDTRSEKIGSAEYGQTYICIQLKNVAAARLIAEQMYHRQEPQTYQCRLPPSIKKNDVFYKVANLVDVNETDPPCDIIFQSKGGEIFRLLAKNRHWEKDFWIDLVGPSLKTNIDVETWRRGTLPGTEDSNNTDTTTDILYIDFEKLGAPYEWHYTKDHSKWAMSETDQWVCVADINRQTSQEKRGGGTVCFKNKLLWESLKDIEKLK